MINFRTSAIAAAVLSSVVFAMPTSSQAMPQAAPVKIVEATNGNFVEVRRYRRYGHNYRRYRHYGRYRHRYNRRHYYANNYYYPNYYRYSSYYCNGYYGGYYGNCGYPYYGGFGGGIPFITLGFGFGFGGHHGHRHW